ncbi:MAG: DUF4058 family protein, partial [Planctomycetaceae bacterium]
RAKEVDGVSRVVDHLALVPAAKGTTGTKAADKADRAKDKADAKADSAKDKSGKIGDKSQERADRAGNEMSDAWITTKLQSKYYLDEDVRGLNIDVTTNGGVVTLTGKVMNAAERQKALSLAKSTDGGLAVAELVADEPLRVRRRSPPQTLRYIQIVDLKANRRVVTAIEFISLPNKATAAGRKQYLAKQSEFIDAEVNLVEIDLLREGTWVLAAEQEIYPERLKSPYRVCVVRAESSEEAELYPAGFAAPLPTIRIPLRPTDEDVLLPLQALVNLANVNGRYGNDLDYSTMPVPPLQADEHAWSPRI